jgi:hypothetical protein
VRETATERVGIAFRCAKGRSTNAKSLRHYAPLFLSLLLIVPLLSAGQDLTWIRDFTAPATSANFTTNELGKQNQLNWDPRFTRLLKDSFPRRQYFWFEHGRFTPLADLIHEFIGVPGNALLLSNRYALINGCVPHDCGDRGFLWIDTESSPKPLLIVAATGGISGDTGGQNLIHVRLFASQKLNWQQLPAEFKTSFAQWWNQTTQIWTKYAPEKVVLVTLVQPSGEEVDLSPHLFAVDEVQAH